MNYVVFKGHDKWFHAVKAMWWDDPTYGLDGQRVDTREEITRVDTPEEARDIAETYNMMVHRRPNSWR